MPGKARMFTFRALTLAPVAAALLLGGCAAFGTSMGSGADSEKLMRRLFPAEGEKSVLRGEAEVGISYAGREMSLPGIVQLGGPDRFRFDLLDPFDRPAAIIYSEEGLLVQFLPTSMSAAKLDPRPEGCDQVSAGAWAGTVLGEPPSHGGSGPVFRRSWKGKARLERFADGDLALRVDYPAAGEAPAPKKVVWYCREGEILSVEFGAFRSVQGRAFPGGFTVKYPRAQLKLTVNLGEMEVVHAAASEALSPFLGPSVRWTAWEMVDGE